MQDLGSFECHYNTGGLDQYLMIQSCEEDKNGIRVIEHYLLDMPDNWKPTSASNDHRRLLKGSPINQACGACNHCINRSTLKQVIHQF